jgi:DNA-binding transcriptional MerR regulator
MIAGMNSRVFRIGEAAQAAGVSPDTLRYYERMGVLSNVRRTDAGYREYSDLAVKQIQFVRNALRFGFSLKQVTTFLRARESGRAPCRQVRAAADSILAHVNQQIKDLKAARRAIRETLMEWDQRLSRTTAGEPARLLEALKPDQIKTDCLSVRLKKGGRG